MPETDIPGRVETAARFVIGLSLGQVVLLFTAGAGTIVLWAMFEARDRMWTQLGNSPVLAGALGMGVFLMLLVAVIGGLLKRSDDNNRALFESMAGQIRDLQAAEKECQRRMFELALHVPPAAAAPAANNPTMQAGA